jgi:anti-sigma factor RsiW
VTDEHLIDDLAAYALGSLEETARARVEAHIVACAACTTRLRAYQGVVGALPLGLAPEPAPLGGWDAIQAAVRGRRTSRGRWATATRWPC